MFMQPRTTRTTASETKTQQVEKGGEWIEGASSRNTVPSGPREKTFGPSRRLDPPDCIPSPRMEAGGEMGQWRDCSPLCTLHLG